MLSIRCSAVLWRPHNLSLVSLASSSIWNLYYQMLSVGVLEHPIKSFFILTCLLSAAENWVLFLINHGNFRAIEKSSQYDAALQSREVEITTTNFICFFSLARVCFFTYLNFLISMYCVLLWQNLFLCVSSRRNFRSFRPTRSIVHPPQRVHIKISSLCCSIWLWLACIRQILFSHFSLAFSNVCKQEESDSVSVAAILTNDWNWATLLWQVDFRFGMGCAIPMRNLCPIWIHVKNMKQFLCIITSDCICLTSDTLIFKLSIITRAPL